MKKNWGFTRTIGKKIRIRFAHSDQHAMYRNDLRIRIGVLDIDIYWRKTSYYKLTGTLFRNGPKYQRRSLYLCISKNNNIIYQYY